MLNRLLTFTLIFIFLIGFAHARRQIEPSLGASVSDVEMKVSFKLETQVTDGMYMGERWVSSPLYTGAVQEGKEFIVEAMAEGFDVMGQAIVINPEWIPEDPEMVTVSPSQSEDVKITVKRAGESSITVSSEGFFKKLFVKAASRDGVMQVEIKQ